MILADHERRHDRARYVRVRVLHSLSRRLVTLALIAGTVGVVLAYLMPPMQGLLVGGAVFLVAVIVTAVNASGRHAQHWDQQESEQLQPWT